MRAAQDPARFPGKRRGLGMIRVSKERDGMTSPEVQRHAIQSFADANNIDILSWVEGIDESGSRKKSAWWPRLDQSVARLVSGEVDVIVVWKFSRTGRNRLKWAIALDNVDAAGGAILSASEPLETKTAAGKFARGMLGEMNAYQADLIGETWMDAHARRFREGKPINGKPRFGYVYDMESKTFLPDPVTGPVLAATYRRYIAGESVYHLVRELNTGSTRPVGGYGAKGDGLWSDRTLRRVLDSGFAAGLINYHGETKRGIHEPLITPDEWDAYQEARGRRRVYRRGERSLYQFSGMIWCECGSKMHGGAHGADRARAYRCRYGKEKGIHDGGYVQEALIEKAVRAWLIEREARVKKETATALAHRPQQTDVDPSAELRARLAKLANKQVMLLEQRIEIGMPQDAYETLRDRYLAEQASLQQELRTVQVRVTAPIRVLPVLLERWDDLLIEERREYLRAIISRIVVSPGRPAARRIDVYGHDDPSE